MVALRNFTDKDAQVLQQFAFRDLSIGQIENVIAEWGKKTHQNRYFEMLAIVDGENIVGTISLYQLTESVLTIGPDVFTAYRRRGFAKQAMPIACELAKAKGYKVALQQVSVDNAASIALHKALRFETDGYEYANQKGNKVLIFVKPLG